MNARSALTAGKSSAREHSGPSAGSAAAPAADLKRYNTSPQYYFEAQFSKKIQYCYIFSLFFACFVLILHRYGTLRIQKSGRRSAGGDRCGLQPQRRKHTQNGLRGQRQGCRYCRLPGDERMRVHLRRPFRRLQTHQRCRGCRAQHA